MKAWMLAFSFVLYALALFMAVFGVLLWTGPTPGRMFIAWFIAAMMGFLGCSLQKLASRERCM